ncbi:MAG: Gfo/Idh/MocA family protein [Anaerolineae bacterium]
MAGKRIGVGISGLGRSGWSIHVRTLQRAMVSDRFRVIAVTDPLAERANEARDLFGCRTYSSYDEMVADPDIELMVVASPSLEHAPQSIAAMRAGKDVLCEKPMTTSLADADRMLAVAAETGRVLTVNQHMRYFPDTRQVREVLASGKLGELLQIRLAVHQFGRRWDWQTLKEFGGGMLNNWGAHMVDLALLLLGDAAPEVFCDMRSTPLFCGGDAEDQVKIILRAPGEPLVDIEMTQAYAYGQDRWQIMGTQGSLTGSGKQLRWKWFDPRVAELRMLSKESTPDRSYNRDTLPWREETWDNSEDTTSGYELLYQDLYETLVHGAPLAVTAESVRRQIAVLEECRRQSAVYA